MSEKFKVWLTDICDDEAVVREVEAPNAYEAARMFAKEEYDRDEYDCIEFDLEDSTGRQFAASADVETEPSFYISCLAKKTTSQ